MPDKSSPRAGDAAPRGLMRGRLGAAIQWRVNEVVELRFAEYDRLLADIETRLNRQRKTLDKASLEAARRVKLLEVLIPQLAALEVRLSEQEREVDEARSIVEEVRREHDRVRARLSGVAWYEDRLRKVEEQLETLTSRMSEERPHG
jgi:uncharacterized coiled-coil protein SlyX